MSENPLKGYYLTRVYKDDDPFTTVMDLFREDAIAACEKATPYRCDNMADYIDRRTEVEGWARESAKAVGVDIKELNPIYFRLTKEPVPKNLHGVISIPADQIDISRCSFTYDDSFNNLAFAESQGGRNGGVPPHPMHGVVFNAEQVAAAVKVYGTLEDDNNKRRYVEVQMWDRPSMDVLPQHAKPRASKSGPKPSPGKEKASTPSEQLRAR